MISYNDLTKMMEKNVKEKAKKDKKYQEEAKQRILFEIEKILVKALLFPIYIETDIPYNNISSESIDAIKTILSDKGFNNYSIYKSSINVSTTIKIGENI